MPWLIITPGGKMITSKIEGKFLKRLESLEKKYSSPFIIYRIVIPPELIWVYYQEYGTATRGEPGKASGVPYDIRPVIGKYLKIPKQDGGYAFVKEIKDHPGIPARYSIKQVLPEIESYCREQLLKNSIISSNKDADKIAKDCAKFAVAKIAESLDRNLKTSEDGKLEGRSPGTVFKKLAKIQKKGG